VTAAAPQNAESLPGAATTACVTLPLNGSSPAAATATATPVLHCATGTTTATGIVWVPEAVSLMAMVTGVRGSAVRDTV
jgi:hypothetical protein